MSALRQKRTWRYTSETPETLRFWKVPIQPGRGAIPPNQTLLLDVTLLSPSAPQPGQAVTENPFSVWSNGRENGAAFTIRP